MLKKTHLAIGFAVAFYFMPHIKTNKLIFLGIVLLASLLPDLETGFAGTGRKSFFKFLRFNWLLSKNKILHTYTLLVLLSILIAIWYPPAAFPFFLGYSFHLFVDAFTTEGIRPFWPLKNRSAGTVESGGRIDNVLFYVFGLVAFALLIKLFV